MFAIETLYQTIGRSSRSIGRPYDDLRKNGIPCTRFPYSATTLQILSTIFFREAYARKSVQRENWRLRLGRKCDALWVRQRDALWLMHGKCGEKSGRTKCVKSKGIHVHSIQAVAVFHLSSAHSPVLLTMHTRIIPQNRPPTLRSKTTDWVTFQNYINENFTLKIPLKTDQGIEDCITSYKSYSRPPVSL